jgi:hypothetical protein
MVTDGRSSQGGGGAPPTGATPGSSRATSPAGDLPDGLLAWFERMSVSGRAFSFRVDVNGALGVAVESDSDEDEQSSDQGPILAGLNTTRMKSRLAVPTMLMFRVALVPAPPGVAVPGGPVLAPVQAPVPPPAAVLPVPAPVGVVLGAMPFIPRPVNHPGQQMLFMRVQAE